MPVQPETHVFRNAAGVTLHADVYRPTVPGARPALLWLHGGALILGSRRALRAGQRDRYLEAGYTVVCPDYRLAPESKLPDIVADVEAAWDWLHTEAAALGLDRHRMAVVGHSAGGYLALLLGTRPVAAGPVPAAVVSFYGYGDILGEWYTLPDPHYLTYPSVSEEQARSAVGTGPLTEGSDSRFPFYLYCRQRGLWPQEVGGRDPRADSAFFRDYCPLHRVTPDSAPALLLHGDSDTDVPYEESVAMQKALAGQGVEARLYTVHGGEHAFDRDEDAPASQAALDEALAFLGRHLGERC